MVVSTCRFLSWQDLNGFAGVVLGTGTRWEIHVKSEVFTIEFITLTQRLAAAKLLKTAPPTQSAQASDADGLQR